jgi:hypothetical protein
MPPKIVPYPRYFRGTEKPFDNDIVVFPAEGSLGTTYFLDIKRWASKPSWALSEMKAAPADEEILRWEAIALGVPSKLPPFKAVKPLEEL